MDKNDEFKYETKSSRKSRINCMETYQNYIIISVLLLNMTHAAPSFPFFPL